MRLKSLLFFLSIGCAAGFFVYRQATSKEEPGRVAVGAQAPDFGIKDETGREIRLGDYRGKVVLLNFFRTDCEPCVAEMDELEALHRKFAGPGFEMLIISQDPDWEPVNDFWKDHRLTMPVGLDPGWVVFRRYRLTGTPETFLIDGDGAVLKHVIGAISWSDSRIARYIEQQIKQPRRTAG
jgi:peroxiredoxin